MVVVDDNSTAGSLMVRMDMLVYQILNQLRWVDSCEQS